MTDPNNVHHDAATEVEEQEMDAADDVALKPGPSADASADVERYISAQIRELYEVYSYRHAAAILANSFPAELREIEKALLNFSLTTREIGMPGGNESDMPKKVFSNPAPRWLGRNSHSGGLAGATART